MMKKFISITVIFVLGIVLLSCSKGEESTITVQGNAKIKVPVDFVSIDVGFSDQGQDINQLEESSYQTMIKLKNILKDKWNMPDSLIQTNRSSINERFNNDSQQAYYRFNQNMTVILDSLELYDTLRRDLIEAGATNYQFETFGTYKEKESKQKALKKAYQNAEEKARQLAQNASFTIGKPQKISSSGQFNIPGGDQIRLASQLSLSMPSPLESSIIKKFIEVETEVDVIFAVE